MARLIDADALLKDIDDYPYGYRGMIKDTIAMQPTVDAVEVVRCENCRWFGEEDDEDGQCWCNLNDISTLRHGFCNFGERRDDK